jgi:hypothetical protein
MNGALLGHNEYIFCFKDVRCRKSVWYFYRQFIYYPFGEMAKNIEL